MERKPFSEDWVGKIIEDDKAIRGQLKKLYEKKLVIDAKTIDTIIRLGQATLEHKFESRAGVITALSGLLEDPTDNVEARRSEIETLLEELKKP